MVAIAVILLLALPAAFKGDHDDGLPGRSRRATLRIHRIDWLGDRGSKATTPSATNLGHASSQFVHIASGDDIVIGRRVGADRENVGGPSVKDRDDFDLHADDEGTNRQRIIEGVASTNCGIAKIHRLFEGVYKLPRIKTSRRRNLYGISGHG